MTSEGYRLWIRERKGDDMMMAYHRHTMLSQFIQNESVAVITKLKNRAHDDLYANVRMRGKDKGTLELSILLGTCIHLSMK